MGVPPVVLLIIFRMQRTFAAVTDDGVIWRAASSLWGDNTQS